MSRPLTDEEVRAAMQTCADEPVHIPGTIQPMGFLLACDFEEGIVRQASQNCPALFDRPIAEILGAPLHALLGPKIWHNMNNIRGLSSFGSGRHFAGIVEQKGEEHAVHVSKGGARFVVEIESAGTGFEASPEAAQQQAFLVSQIEACGTLQELLDLTVRLLRHVTGFDRATIMRFDKDWNGEIAAEARSSLVDPLVGLRFPSHDFPAQARELMRRIPLRLICDVGQAPIPLIGTDPDEPPLDMTFAVLRGVSPIHMQYLHNFGLGATMTLSVTLGDDLWGIISFHSTLPRVAPPETRRLLLSFLPVFRLKLDLLRRENSLRLSQRIDQLQTDIRGELEKGSELAGMLLEVGPSILDVLGAEGVVMTNGSQNLSFGKVPDTAVVQAVSDRAGAQSGQVLAVDNLREAFPDLLPYLQGFAGVLVTVYEDARSLQVFRPEISQSVTWAGNPTKEIELVEGNMRIAPRGVFSAYLEEVEHKCKSWTREDIQLMRQLWPLLSAAERRAFLADLNRQQALMIDELNHRVRNILALVNSVSTQALRTGGTLESYSNAFESRIHALAAAHDIGAGAARSAVSIFDIIGIEAAPYRDEGALRVRISGENVSIRAESAPIFALVIHELMTNAVKYGALSVPEGLITVDVTRIDDGVEITWKERGGPPVREPGAHRFGTTLIRQAVPFELGGRSGLRFASDGVEAMLMLPFSVLGDTLTAVAPVEPPAWEAPEERVRTLSNKLVMLVEDNFMIADAMRSQLESMGFVNLELMSNVAGAMAFLGQTTPGMAILDINLGQGQNTEPVANELLARGVPFIFVTGYGEHTNLPPHLRQVPTVTKPATASDLMAALDQLAR